jgi:lysozyme
MKQTRLMLSVISINLALLGSLTNSYSQVLIPKDSMIYVKKLYRGIDISHYNGDLVKEIDSRDSLSFVICKATQGLSIVDKNFKMNWNVVKSKNLLLGTYHFYMVGEDPVKQAEHYFQTIDAMGKLDIAGVVDIEQGSIPKGYKVNKAQLQADLIKFLDVLQSKIHRVPMIYTCSGFANQYLNNNAFSKYPLWLAEYTNAVKPKLPATWSKTGYKIWQKSEKYQIDSKPTDFDVYYGSLVDLCK